MKNIQSILCLVLFSGCFLVTSNALAQYEKDPKKAQLAYIDGDYEGSNKDIDKVIEKSIKKIGENNKFIPIALIRQAIIQSALGILVDVIPLTEEAVAKSEDINGADSP